MITAGGLLFTNCEDNPNPIALQDRNSQIVSDTLYATYDSTYALDKVITTLNSNRLLLGSLENFNFRIVLKFSLSELPDSLEIDDAWIRFVTVGAEGEMPTEFSATGYPPIENWGADTSGVWKNYADNVDFTKPLGDMSVTTADDDTLTFHFNDLGLKRVRLWAGQDSSIRIENTGMFLDFTAANFIKEFQARDVLTNQGVYLYVADYIRDTTGVADSVVVDSFLAITDAFLIDGQFQPVMDRTNTATLTPWATLLGFNLDSLREAHPSGLVVTSANLQLPVDWNNSLIHKDFGPRLQLISYKFEKDNADRDSLVVDYSLTTIPSLVIDLNQYTSDSSYVEATGGGERKEFAANYVQVKLNFPDNFAGFYIENKFQDQYLAYYSFYRYNSPDRQKRPRLVIQSLRFPDERL